MNHQSDGEIVVIRFTSDMTLRWACRAGDYLIWARFSGYDKNLGLLDPRRSGTYKPADLWQLTDGSFVTITNRYSDFPDWLDLRPSEVGASFGLWMKKRLEEGHVPPAEPADFPNIWRVFMGDRIAWVGPSRAGVHSDQGVLELVEFSENALVYGAPIDVDSSGDFPVPFAAFLQVTPSDEGMQLCRAGWDAINQLGFPCSCATDDEWIIG